MSTLASVFGYGLLSARPAAAVAGRFYYATDTTFMYRDNGSTWDTLAVGAGSMATDALWDAKGDLAAGTGANTGAKLTVGADDTMLMADAAQTTGLKWVGPGSPSTQAFGDSAAAGTSDTYERGGHKHGMPAAASLPGHEFDYVEKTSSTSITASSEATANTVITATGVAYNGSQRIMVEFCAGYLIAPAGQSILLALYDDTGGGAASIGILGQFGSGGTTNVEGPVLVRRFLTPSNATHTFSVRAYTGGLTGTVQGGAGGSGAFMPTYIRQALA